MWVETPSFEDGFTVGVLEYTWSLTRPTLDTDRLTTKNALNERVAADKR